MSTRWQLGRLGCDERLDGIFVVFFFFVVVHGLQLAFRVVSAGLVESSEGALQIVFEDIAVRRA